MKYYIAVQKNGSWRVLYRAQSEHEALKRYDRIEVTGEIVAKAVMQLASAHDEPVLICVAGPTRQGDTWHRWDTELSPVDLPSSDQSQPSSYQIPA